MAMNKERLKKLKSRKKKLQEAQSGGTMLFIKADTTVRVRPLPVDENEEFGLEIITCYLGPEIKGVLSPSTFGLPCALNEKYQKLKASKDPDDQELAKGALKPKKKYVVPVIKYKDLKGTKVDEQSGVKLLQLANSAYQKMVDYSLDAEAGDFTDPKEGYDLKVSRTGSGQFDTEYGVINCKPTPLHKKFNKIYDIKELLMKEMPTYEETKEKLAQFMGGDEDEPRKKKKKKPSSSASVGTKTGIKKKKKPSDL